VRNDSWKGNSSIPFSIRDSTHRAADKFAVERDIRVDANKRSRILER
jgi:hypothetical protein